MRTPPEAVGRLYYFRVILGVFDDRRKCCSTAALRRLSEESAQSDAKNRRASYTRWRGHRYGPQASDPIDRGRLPMAGQNGGHRVPWARMFHSQRIANIVQLPEFNAYLRTGYIESGHFGACGSRLAK